MNVYRIIYGIQPGHPPTIIFYIYNGPLNNNHVDFWNFSQSANIELTITYICGQNKKIRKSYFLFNKKFIK